MQIETVIVNFWTFEDGWPVKLAEYHDIGCVKAFGASISADRVRRKPTLTKRAVSLGRLALHHGVAQHADDGHHHGAAHAAADDVLDHSGDIHAAAPLILGHCSRKR